MPLGNFNVSSDFVVGSGGASVLTVFIPRADEQRRCQQGNADAIALALGAILRRWCVLRGFVDAMFSRGRSGPGKNRLSNGVSGKSVLAF